MQISKDLYLGEKGFIFDPSTGVSYSLNKAGAYIFQLMRQGFDNSEITEKLIKKFRIDPKIARDDLRDFTQRLNDL